MRTGTRPILHIRGASGEPHTDTRTIEVIHPKGGTSCIVTIRALAGGALEIETWRAYGEIRHVNAEADGLRAALGMRDDPRPLDPRPLDLRELPNLAERLARAGHHAAAREIYATATAEDVLEKVPKDCAGGYASALDAAGAAIDDARDAGPAE